MMINPIDPSKKIHLKNFDASDNKIYATNKEDAKKQLKDLNKQLATLQDVLYAENKHKILIILQAMDTGGKDGTIRHVFKGVNPQGVRVANFKVPSEEELDHDYLWRVHKQTPGCGEIVIFNRSHYEDVLVVRVHQLVTENIWKRRYAQINEFERLLVEEGTTILKFYLHIDKDEQKDRLQARLDEPNKRWKFNPNDLKERNLWLEYISAYEDVINKTTTKFAPWYVIPANKKWLRNLLIAEIIVEKLKSLEMIYPEITFDPKSIKID